jgi:hypothetical protein
MNPAIAALLAQAEAQGLVLVEQAVQRFVGDVLAGVSVQQAALNLSMWAAEQQALAVDKIADSV